LHLFASEYPVSYELSGSLAQVYTGTLNNSESIEVELTSGDGEKHIS
jgi:predicted unusual protein kinase regulating ubiquinone biosynthesis (AarF/ABC1/UbiB family)